MSQCQECEYNHFEMVADTENSFEMWQGLVGPHYTPHVDGAGNLYWTNNGGLPNPEMQNIVGNGIKPVGIVTEAEDLPETASQGDAYIVGTEVPYRMYFYNEGAWVDIGYTPGPAGQDGVSPVISIEDITGGHKVTITDADHPDGMNFNVMDGEDGQDGQDGAPGVGVPASGSAGQVLKKNSATDYDTAWGDLDAGEIGYNSTATYSADTVGKTLSDQAGDIGDLETIAGDGVLSGFTATDLTGAANELRDTLTTSTAITTGTDLNTLTTPGSYSCSTGTIAQSLSHCPVIYGFMMHVYPYGSGVAQLIIGDRELCYRRAVSEDWQIAARVSSVAIMQNGLTATKNLSEGQYVIWRGSLGKVNSGGISSGTSLAFGTGNNQMTAVDNGGLNDIFNLFSFPANASVSGADLNNYKSSGIWYINGGSPSHTPTGSYGILIVFPAGTTIIQIYFPAGSDYFCTRRCVSNTWTNWFKHLGTQIT